MQASLLPSPERIKQITTTIRDAQPVCTMHSPAVTATTTDGVAIIDLCIGLCMSISVAVAIHVRTAYVDIAVVRVTINTSLLHGVMIMIVIAMIAVITRSSSSMMIMMKTMMKIMMMIVMMTMMMIVMMIMMIITMATAVLHMVMLALGVLIVVDRIRINARAITAVMSSEPQM